jgi:hypothetical protein
MAHAPTPVLNRLRSLVVLAGLVASLASAQESTGSGAWLESLHLSATGTASWVENISRTSYEPTRKDAATYEFNLSSSIPRQLAPSVLLVGSAELSSFFVDQFSLDDNTTGTARVSLQRKFGLGPQAWILQGSVGGGYKAARLDDDRGFSTEASIQLSKRILPNLRVAAIGRWLDHNAKSEVFDLDQQSLSLEAQWDINQHWTLSGSATRLQGDIVANAAWSVWSQMLAGAFGPTTYNYYTSRPWSVTNLYGPGWVSYNVEGDVDLWSVALAYAWTDRTSIELRKGAAYVVNRAGVAYPTSTIGLSLSHRF